MIQIIVKKSHDTEIQDNDVGHVDISLPYNPRLYFVQIIMKQSTIPTQHQ